jgi:transcriptional regulator with XRE-family HTH domain
LSIHSRIKYRRVAIGLESHKALADLLGVAWQTVQLWEKEGGTAPNRKRMNAVAAALQVSPEWLVTGRAATDDQSRAFVRN